MHALSAAELLDVWERGLTQSATQRALTLLGAACPEISQESLTSLSVGDRDARLMTLREWTFGPQLIGIATCVNCCARLELTLNSTDLASSQPPAAEQSFSLSVDDYELNFRLPNSSDLTELAACRDLVEGKRLLLERCISSVEHQGEQTAIEGLPAAVIAGVVEQMGRIDKSGDVRLDLNCSQCGGGSQTIFDIESFFWKEINAWANRILREVHALASAYGWSEIDVLNMTAWRRQAYLSLIGS